MMRKTFCDICGKDTKAKIEITLCRTIGEHDEEVRDEHYDLCWDCNDALLKFVDERKGSVRKITPIYKKH
jgi:hypothetical protein